MQARLGSGSGSGSGGGGGGGGGGGSRSRSRAPSGAKVQPATFLGSRPFLGLSAAGSGEEPAASGLPPLSFAAEVALGGAEARRHLGALMGDVQACESLVTKSLALQKESSAKVAKLVAAEAAAQKRATVAELKALELEALLMIRQLGGRV